jgi:hypothetical protein
MRDIIPYLLTSKSALIVRSPASSTNEFVRQFSALITVFSRRNNIRPIKVFCNLFFAFASLWLLFAFLFKATHFADTFPSAIRFAFSWVTNDIARMVLGLMFVGGLISALVNIVRYATFTSTVREEPSEQPPSSSSAILA